MVATGALSPVLALPTCVEPVAAPVMDGVRADAELLLELLLLPELELPPELEPPPPLVPPPPPPLPAAMIVWLVYSVVSPSTHLPFVYVCFV